MEIGQSIMTWFFSWRKERESLQKLTCDLLRVVHTALPTITHNMIRTSVRRITSNARMFKRLQSGGASEGATVTSKGGISDKEKAVENQWARMHVSRPPCILWNLCNHITNKLCVSVG